MSSETNKQEKTNKGQVKGEESIAGSNKAFSESMCPFDVAYDVECFTQPVIRDMCPMAHQVQYRHDSRQVELSVAEMIS